MADWDRLKAELLVKDQVKNSGKVVEDEVVTNYEIEISWLADSLEKKEYTLQLLETWLHKCEAFLWQWGRNDEFIREELKTLKLNPDFEKKKISNVVDENIELKQLLKEALDEIEQLH